MAIQLISLRASPFPPPFRFRLLLGLGLIILAGCAGHRPAEARLVNRPTAAPSPAVFPTVDEAVRDAFQTAARESGPTGRVHLRLGTIRRVEGGFVWTRPVRSKTSVTSPLPLRVRLALGPDDVAVYGLHPHSGLDELDRSNEEVTASERRLVDEQDPFHRPLYVLTPSRRVVRYPDETTPLEVVSRERLERRP